MSTEAVELSDPSRLVDQPVVSVLVLAYNHGPYLAECLDAVLGQHTSYPFEVLIGEDRSQDDTFEIAAAYQARYPSCVRLVTSQANVGMQENFRRLVQASRGPYLAICEGDDYWSLPTKLEDQVDFLEAHGEFGALHSDFTHLAPFAGGWRALPAFWSHHAVSIPQGHVFEELLIRNFIQTCTLMVRRSHAISYFESGLPTGTYLVGDWPLCLHLSSRWKVGYSPQPTATYRKVPGSATNRGSAADIARARDHMRMVTDFCRLLDVDSALESRAHTQAMRDVVGIALRTGNLDELRQALVWFDARAKEDLPTHLRTAARLAATGRPASTAFRAISDLRQYLLMRHAYEPVARSD